MIPSPLLCRVTSSDDAEARLAAGELFGEYVEPLCDAFSREAAERYVELFGELIAHCRPLTGFGSFDHALTEAGVSGADALRARYRQLRAGAGTPSSPQRIYFLSRVTLGADVAVTSVFLRYCAERFPSAERVLVGSAKLGELYAADASVRMLELPYVRRGTLADRFAAWVELRDRLVRDAADLPDGSWVVVDPDSRLTQLGLLPVTRDLDRHWYFPSREVGEDSASSLPSLAKDWLARRFGAIAGTPRPYVAPSAEAYRRVAERVPSSERPLAVVNFGTGGNESKSAGLAWEAEVVRALGERGFLPAVDAGFGDAEEARARAIVDASDVEAQLFRGTIAELAALMTHARLYVGYDSAGAHLAAASGIHCVDVFHNPISERHMARWTPPSVAPVHVVHVTPGDGVEGVLRALP